MAKPDHPVIAWEADVIANAVSWSAFQFRGVHGRQKATAETREEAVAFGRAMLEDDPHRAVLIYAVNREGRTALAETLRSSK
jgi:hypothetical protein